MPEPITIIFQTYKRTDYALRTIAAARKYLRYPDLRWYVADDGSPREHLDAVITALDGVCSGFHSERLGYGGSANKAWRWADSVGPLTFWLEDDWELRQPLDLYCCAALLMEREEIGMVRLGVLNLDIRGRTWGHNGLVYWTLDREPHIEGTPVFTGHPSLRHRRYRDAYGWYPEGLGPGDTELAYAYQYRIGAHGGPGIVWPVGYPQNGYFGHIGAVKTETLDEGGS
jgi:GT2 family glycosyltransferase